MILTEGVVLAVVGGVAGVGLGWVAYNFLIGLLSPGSGLTIPAMLVQAGKAMIIALLVGALGALGPAWRAAGMMAAAALRRQ